MIQICMKSLGEKSVTNSESKNARTKQKITLNQSQMAHLKGEINVYAPIESYYEEWNHVEDSKGNFVSASPKEGTRRRSDMPSLAQQWREDWARRCKAMEKLNGKSTSNR